MRREGPHFSAPPPRAASAPTAAVAASSATSSVATGAPSAASSGSPLERSRRGGKKHVRKAQSPQTLFAEELAKAL
jgi:hypothetical protein